MKTKNRARQNWGLMTLVFLTLVLLMGFSMGGGASKAQGPGGSLSATPPAAPWGASAPAQRLYLPITMHTALHTTCRGQVDPPSVGWATGPEGVLLRWRWPGCYPAPTAYKIYRNGALLATVARVTDESQAIAILGDSLWTWLQSTYDVSTMAELHAFLDGNPAADLWLADQHERLARVRGLGYLDAGATLGKTYTYRITALVPEDIEYPVGEVRATAASITPLTAPTGLQEVQVLDEGLMGSPDWARAQQNRKADSRVFLRWDLPGDSAPPPPTWVTSYDIYRATSPGGPYQRINIRNGEDSPVAPSPSYEPDTLPGDSPYQQYDYFYQDDDPALQACHTYYYRIAPRDLLGRPRDWSDPAQRSQFSAFIAATPPDTVPPAAPQGLNATPDHLAGAISLSWNPVADAAQYIVYRSDSPEAAWPGLNPAAASQWVTMTITSGTSWVDKSASYEQQYWYVVRAQDAPCGGHPPNLSAPSQPVHAILHDRTPPAKPKISMTYQYFGDTRVPIVVVQGPPGDTGAIGLYCSFDNGPEHLITTQKGETLALNLFDYYQPPYPLPAACRAIAIDPHGNHSHPSVVVTGSIPVLPGRVPPPSAPIIRNISTEVGGSHGWTAKVTWDALDAPCLAGFRLYRQAAGQSQTLLADETTLDVSTSTYADTTVQWGVVYTYTVAAYRPHGACGAEKEAPSQPQAYRVTQPPELPGRPLVTLAWDHPSYSDGEGTTLRWQSERKRMNFVVFRSLSQTAGYVAITPPMRGTHYLDTSAHHDRYWYVVVGLDPVTGEVITATAPWSAGQAGAALAESSAAPLPQPETAQEPLRFAGLPSVLTFGDGFELHVTSYDPGSTLSDLNGDGHLYLYPNGQLLKVSLTFSHLQADKNGVILAGQIDVPAGALPINMAGSNKFHYQVTALQVDRNGGSGSVKLYLPGSIYYHWYLVWPVHLSGLDDYVMVTGAVIHPQLIFQRVANYDLPCEEDTATYFQLEDLPWDIIPTGVITYTDTAITFDSVCTRYHERYTGTRPGSTEPDANDGLLRPTFTSSNAIIYPDGLAGDFNSNAVVNYTVPFPYDFHLTLMHPSLTLEGGVIQSGHVLNLNNVVSFDYFQSVPQTNPWADKGGGTPEGHWTGTLSAVSIGPGGSIYARATKANTFPKTPDISWLDGGFTLSNRTYELFIPPIQSQRLPWAEALWPTDEHETGDGMKLESGLNLRTASDAGLSWNDCSTAGPITFPGGVKADLYIRRGGISDLLQAYIPAGSPQNVTLDGYQTRLQSFMAVFLDNSLSNKDISGSFYLPGPSDALIPFADAMLDENACIANADVTSTTITPAYWQTTLHPTSLEFRPPDPDPDADGERGLWLIGGVDLPHMAPTTATTIAAIPLETAFKPDGDFFDITLQYDAVNYQLNGLPYLLEDVRLSDWRTREDPHWVADAGLNAPPASSWQDHGFIGLEGNLLAPIFGTVQGKSSGAPPEIYLLGWDPYVGFSDSLRVERDWTVVTNMSWGFDLLYVPNPEQDGALLAGFRQDDYKVVKLDQALVLMGKTGQEPRFDLLLGQSSGTGLLRAMAEETQRPLPADYDAIRPTLASWRSAYFSGMDESYLDFLGTLWSRYGNDDFTQTTAKIDGMKDKDIPQHPRGAQAGVLEPMGVKLQKLRGDLAWFYDANTNDWDFDELRISLWLDIKKSSQKEPLFHGDRITFRLTRDNDYVLEAMGLKSSIFKQSDLSIDFTGVVNPDEPKVEVGLMLHNLNVDPVQFRNIGAALGVGNHIYYLGALADAKYQGVAIGGAFLFGEIDPNSIVLRNMGFADLLDTLGMTGSSTTILAGGYLRFYGDVPIYNYSCLFNVHVGGRIAVWYFADMSPEHSGADAWGGQLGGYVTGQLLCVVSARGDLTLSIYQQPDKADLSMRGQFWVAGGIGACDPSTWDSWDKRWWNDKWCWTCGAMVEANYNVDKVDDWAWDYAADYE